MELANCYLLGEAGPKLEDAKIIFEDIKDAFPGDPVARLRLAQTIISIEESRTTIATSVALLQEAISRASSDPLTAQEHWIKIALQTALSFMRWRLAQQEIKDHQNDKAASAVKAAATDAFTGFELWLSLPAKLRDTRDCKLHAHRVLSSLLHYAAWLIHKGHEDKFVNKENLRKWISDLASIKIEKFRDYFKTEENLMRAHLALGDMDSARALANTIFQHFKGTAETRAARELSLGEIGTMLHRDEITEFRSAAAVLIGAAN